MVTFAEKISKFKFEDPISSLEDALSDLEKQGFSVNPIRNKLRSLLLTKSRHDQGRSISEEINKLEKESSEIEKEISEIDQSIAELHRRRVSALLERKRRNPEISGLQQSLETMKETLESSRREFVFVLI